MAATFPRAGSYPAGCAMQRCETDCAAFILLAFKAKRKIQKELPQEKGIILGQQPQMKEQHEQHFSFKVMSSGGATQRCPVP